MRKYTTMFGGVYVCLFPLSVLVIFLVFRFPVLCQSVSEDKGIILVWEVKEEIGWYTEHC